MKHEMGEYKLHSINNPLILTIEDFLPEETVDTLMDDINEHCVFKEAIVSTEDGTGEYTNKRNNQTSSLNFAQSDGARMFLDMASATLRVHPSQAEPLSVIKYLPGQQFEPHLDAFGEDKIESYSPQAGNRIATAILYLNDVQHGGETDFPNMGITIPAKKGTCVFFSNTFMGTCTPIDLSMHAGMPVIRGEKTAVNLWFRSGVYDNNMYQKWLESQQSV